MSCGALLPFYLLFCIPCSRGYHFFQKAQNLFPNRQRVASRSTLLRSNAWNHAKGEINGDGSVNTNEEDKEQLAEELIELCDELWRSVLDDGDSTLPLGKRAAWRSNIDRLTKGFSIEMLQPTFSLSSSPSPTSLSSPSPMDLFQQSTPRSSPPFSSSGTVGTYPDSSTAAKTAHHEAVKAENLSTGITITRSSYIHVFHRFALLLVAATAVTDAMSLMDGPWRVRYSDDQDIRRRGKKYRCDMLYFLYSHHSSDQHHDSHLRYYVVVN